jgi:NADH:ubiquinone oxidoreductase subunit 5 (subunit L)/multisubunit Na+/H+ antiporter MnhA subunit
MNFQDSLPYTLLVTVAAPGACAVLLGLFTLLTGRTPSERTTAGIIRFGLLVSLVGGVLTAIGAMGGRHEVDFGPWIHIGSYEVPIVFVIDAVSVSFSLLAAAITGLVARFSATYMHKERGFLRFFVLLGVFSTGTQMASYAGALDLLFLGWELVGISSMLFIGFFHERPEPVRSSIRAFSTYRVCDAGLLFAIVVAHGFLGSTRLSAMAGAPSLTTFQATSLALLFVLAAIGKSAQLPFSGWLPRALEGPTPTSALFYGGVSIHLGLFLILRVWPVMEVAPVAKGLGVALGLATALYASAVTRTCSDAKGALAHATLAQVGLILAEICAGLTTLALVHIVGHALLRVWQYLRAPNMIHDAHRTNVASHVPEDTAPAGLGRAFYGSALFRLRIDERIDRIVALIVAIGRGIDHADQKLRGMFRAAPEVNR